MLAREVGPTGTVIALEASQHNAQVGMRNRELNNAENLVVLHAAVAEHSGSVIFNQGLNGQVDDGRGEWGRVRVAALSIDDLARTYGQPDVVFIDIEGFELAALRGASRTLAFGPDWFIEMHAGCGLERLGGSVEAVRSFFSEDYRIYAARPGEEFRVVGVYEQLPSERFFLAAFPSAPKSRIVRA